MQPMWLLTIHLLKQTIWGGVWNFTLEKNRTIVSNVTINLFRYAIWRDNVKFIPCYKCTDFDFEYAQKWHLKTLLETFQKLQAFQTYYKINTYIYWQFGTATVTISRQNWAFQLPTSPADVASGINFWTKAIKFGFCPRWTTEKSAVNLGKLSYVI